MPRINKLNKKAWNTLTEDEQTALGLQLVMDKSSWQSGEVMGKSHYKYLEIKYRAQYFLKLFTDYIETLGTLVPEYLKGDRIAIKFFRLCIEKRLKPIEAISIITAEEREAGNQRVKKSVMNEKIINQLKEWDKKTDATEAVMVDFIKEFDRWNNFRILPKAIQEPSAYKRRIKNVYKKHLRLITNIHPLSLAKLLKICKTNSNKCLYMPLIISKEPIIQKVKAKPQVLQLLNEIGFYVFTDFEDAQVYLEEVHKYVSKKKKECRDGLDFWPNYRELIKKAMNYENIQKITPNRKYLQLALQKYTLL